MNHKIKTRLRTAVLLAALAATSACTHRADIVAGALTQPDRWHPIFTGIDLRAIGTDDPRPLHIYAARIDLHQPTVAFLATPSNGPQPNETNGRKTSEFLTEFGCQLAVNASPYKPFGTLPSGTPQDVIGLSVSQGDAYSQPNPAYAAVVISQANQARIIEQDTPAPDAHNAVGGFGRLLKDGANVASDDALHPRTAAGVSQDGRFLYLMVIDGRQSGYSEGVTTTETADWIARLGAYNAVNLDGGGSSTMVIATEAGPRLINRPIHSGLPGNERVNANHLGVFARSRR